MSLPRAVCLMGPTASRKTELAVELAEILPLDIVSVDSAMVYRGMDIGTAKPDRLTLARAPHRLLDIRNPEEKYSAGDFVRDAHCEMARIRAAGRVPFLVGGTMMYFRALTRGMADLPPADPVLRAAIDAEAAAAGWPALHRQLAEIDPAVAGRISPNDSQRIQRALEVYRATGKPLGEWQRGQPERAPGEAFLRIAVVPGDRPRLHRRIGRRLSAMLRAGFDDEVRRLRARPALSRASPSMRAVGYRQMWSWLEGEADRATTEAAIRAATRQLAKRQMTWLRAEPDLAVFDPLERDVVAAIKSRIGFELAQF